MELHGNKAYLTITEQRDSGLPSTIDIDFEELGPIHKMQEDAKREYEKLLAEMNDEGDDTIRHPELSRRLHIVSAQVAISENIAKSVSRAIAARRFREELDRGLGGEII